MTKIQTDIGAWHRATFGNKGIIDRIRRKLEEEASEADAVLFLEDWRDSAQELADVCICCYALADRIGFDLDREIVRKFTEVSKRTDQVERDKARGIG